MDEENRSDRRTLIHLFELYNIRAHSSKTVHCVRENTAEYSYFLVGKRVFVDCFCEKMLLAMKSIGPPI
jgi:hypothetical protein